jgi:hypothetical protein
MKTMSTNKEVKMRDYEYLPAGQRKLAEQLDEEDFKREERKGELEAAKGELEEVFGWLDDLKSDLSDYEIITACIDDIETSLCNIEENILEVLNKYN